MLFRIAKVITIVLLIIATDVLPYDYYTLLRFIVCGVSIYGVYNTYHNKLKIWPWVFGVIAVLFNPLLPIHLDRTTWVFIDFLVAAIYLISLWTPEKVTLRNSIIGVGLLAIVVVATLWVNTLNEIHATCPGDIYVGPNIPLQFRLANELYRPWLLGTSLATFSFALITHIWQGAGKQVGKNGDNTLSSLNTLNGNLKEISDQVISYADGMYTGKLKNKLPHGQGVWIHSTGIIEYIGNWKDGKFHGEGIYKHRRKGKYIGEFQSGTRHGVGSFYYSDGVEYTGQWKNDTPNGRGKLVRQNGDIREGRWEKGKFIG